MNKYIYMCTVHTQGSQFKISYLKEFENKLTQILKYRLNF